MDGQTAFSPRLHTMQRGEKHLAFDLYAHDFDLVDRAYSPVKCQDRD